MVFLFSLAVLIVILHYLTKNSGRAKMLDERERNLEIRRGDISYAEKEIKRREAEAERRLVEAAHKASELESQLLDLDHAIIEKKRALFEMSPESSHGSDNSLTNIAAIRGELFRKGAELDLRSKDLESEISSRVKEGMSLSASKVASRPYFQNTAAFQALVSDGSINDNERLITALNENAALSYPLRIGTQIRGKTGIYTVTLDSCTCEDFKRRQKPCKHMLRLALEVGVLLSVSEEDKREFFLKYTQIRDAAEREKDLAMTESAKLAREKGALQKRSDSIKRIMRETSQSAPWLSKQIADYFDILDRKVENELRERRAAKAAEEVSRIRKEKRTLLLQNKLYEYQLNFYESMFPWLVDFKEIPVQDAARIAEDETSAEASDEQKAMLHWLSPEEYKELSDVEKYQLALDRYVDSRKKSSWQIGRDYELSVAHEYRQEGFDVTTYGSLKRLEDMGRDLICVKGPLTLIIQCKYWARTKTIHEKHIFQLYGSMVSYRIEHPYTYGDVRAVFVTNTTLSETARKVSDYLKISVVENHSMVDFPRIKCNIGRDENGEPVKIFHLPMDDQYDNVQIKNRGEFYAFTVREAVDAGFRRAYRWRAGNK